jgi:anti-sigma B factor antagonist
MSPGAAGAGLKTPVRGRCLSKSKDVFMAEQKTGKDLIGTISRDGDTATLAVLGEVDLHNSADLRAALLQMIAKDPPKKIVLNLSEVPYVDSSAIAVLVEILQKLRKTGGKVVLSHLQPRVKGLLEIARLDTIFPIVNE